MREQIGGQASAIGEHEPVIAAAARQVEGPVAGDVEGVHLAVTLQLVEASENQGMQRIVQRIVAVVGIACGGVQTPGAGLVHAAQDVVSRPALQSGDVSKATLHHVAFHTVEAGVTGRVAGDEHAQAAGVGAEVQHRRALGGVQMPGHEGAVVESKGVVALPGGQVFHVAARADGVRAIGDVQGVVSARAHRGLQVGGYGLEAKGRGQFVAVEGDGVVAAACRFDHRVATPARLEDIGVVPAAAFQRIVPRAAVEDVRPGVADEGIIAAAGDDVLDVAQRIVADAARGFFVRRAGAEIHGDAHRVAAFVVGVVARAAIQQVVARAAGQEVIAAEAVNLIVAIAADQHVGAVVAVNHVAGLRCADNPLDIAEALGDVHRLAGAQVDMHRRGVGAVIQRILASAAVDGTPNPGAVLEDEGVVAPAADMAFHRIEGEAAAGGVVGDIPGVVVAGASLRRGGQAVSMGERPGHAGIQTHQRIARPGQRLRVNQFGRHNRVDVLEAALDGVDVLAAGVADHHPTKAVQRGNAGEAHGEAGGEGGIIQHVIAAPAVHPACQVRAIAEDEVIIILAAPEAIDVHRRRVSAAVVAGHIRYRRVVDGLTNALIAAQILEGNHQSAPGVVVRTVRDVDPGIRIGEVGVAAVAVGVNGHAVATGILQLEAVRQVSGLGRIVPGIARSEGAIPKLDDQPTAGVEILPRRDVLETVGAVVAITAHNRHAYTGVVRQAELVSAAILADFHPVGARRQLVPAGLNARRVKARHSIFHREVILVFVLFDYQGVIAAGEFFHARGDGRRAHAGNVDGAICRGSVGIIAHHDMIALDIEA